MSQPENQSATLEGEVFYPAKEIVSAAHIQDYDLLYADSINDPGGFWADRAAELEWFEPWEKVLDDSNPPFFKWFVGGKTNIVHNALDRHMKTYRKNKLALIWEGEPGDKRTLFVFCTQPGGVQICQRADAVWGCTKAISSRSICRASRSR